MDTAAAYQAYLGYVAIPQTVALAAFQSAQTRARDSLNSAIVADLGTLTTTPDSTVLSAASTVAQQVITEQGIVTLPPPAVSYYPQPGFLLIIGDASWIWPSGFAFQVAGQLKYILVLGAGFLPQCTFNEHSHSGCAQDISVDHVHHAQRRLAGHSACLSLTVL